uniref:Tsg N-terminal domain-containing protein n=1 Tax=Romanomermis culicivorax TaxID=13658 RepID=A0A915HKV4_ROMCU
MSTEIFVFSLILGAMFLMQISAQDEKTIYYNDGCSEETCGAIVSKCMLLKSCNCSMTPADLVGKNCTCCRECVTCLGDLFSKCCACVGA